MRSKRRSLRSHVAATQLIWVGFGCAGGTVPPPPPGAIGAPHKADRPDSVAVLIGAGDVANCHSDGDELTAHLIDSLLGDVEAPTWVFTTGDNAYEYSSAKDFANCYEPSWGRFKSITRPVPGNHDYKNGYWVLSKITGLGHATPYFTYFNEFPDQAGAPGKGWYRYQHGTWDIFALNTRKRRMVVKNSEQWDWLVEQLSGSRTECSLVYLHHPRFGASKHGDEDRMRDTWQLLADHGVDVMVAGHEHNYQRFAPQDSLGAPRATGMRQFVVGTGGTHLVADSSGTNGALEKWHAADYGVVKLSLRPGSYEWEFIIQDGSAWDAGASTCQNDR